MREIKFILYVYVCVCVCVCVYRSRLVCCLFLTECRFIYFKGNGVLNCALASMIFSNFLKY
jgi:hypothetical protein